MSKQNSSSLVKQVENNIEISMENINENKQVKIENNEANDVWLSKKNTLKKAEPKVSTRSKTLWKLVRMKYIPRPNNWNIFIDELEMNHFIRSRGITPSPNRGCPRTYTTLTNTSSVLLDHQYVQSSSDQPGSPFGLTSFFDEIIEHHRNLHATEVAPLYSLGNHSIVSTPIHYTNDEGLYDGPTPWFPGSSIGPVPTLWNHDISFDEVSSIGSTPEQWAHDESFDDATIPWQPPVRFNQEEDDNQEDIMEKPKIFKGNRIQADVCVNCQISKYKEEKEEMKESKKKNIIEEKEEEKIFANVMFGPDSCSCLAFCLDCVNDGLETSLRRVAIENRMNKLGAYEPHFDALSISQILFCHPYLLGHDIKPKCCVCKKAFNHLVRRSLRPKRKSGRICKCNKC
uniref:Uncharacterized protein n=1 Tax=Meloidogyne javanica TaxID=6303 RepID=A0A915N2L3_MELJA